MAEPTSVNKLNHQKPTDQKDLVFTCLATVKHKVPVDDNWPYKIELYYHFEDLLPGNEIAWQQLHFTNQTIPFSLMLNK